jgi:hypothetical protein
MKGMVYHEAQTMKHMYVDRRCNHQWTPQRLLFNLHSVMIPSLLIRALLRLGRTCLKDNRITGLAVALLHTSWFRGSALGGLRIDIHRCGKRTVSICKSIVYVQSMIVDQPSSSPAWEALAALSSWLTIKGKSRVLGQPHTGPCRITQTQRAHTRVICFQVHLWFLGGFGSGLWSKFLKFGCKSLGSGINHWAKHLLAEIGPVALGDTGTDTFRHFEKEVNEQEASKERKRGKRIGGGAAW